MTPEDHAVAIVEAIDEYISDGLDYSIDGRVVGWSWDPNRRSQLAEAVRAALDPLHEAVPCQSCGADPRVSPPSGAELPIVRGALDAQAAAEQALGTVRAEHVARAELVKALREVAGTLTNAGTQFLFWCLADTLEARTC